MVLNCCASAIRQGKLIRRVNRQDKEFHFQNWFQERLTESGFLNEVGGRNSYPDFRMVMQPEGYEIKGLAYPGRETTYDCNRQVPRGLPNGRTVFYAFGRYPSQPDGDSYPVLDFVLCHGNFLNVDHDYIHKNKSVRGFGSYGDILIRDRKMYVAPTPFGIAHGLAHAVTLIIPADWFVPKEYAQVGTIIREETDQVVSAYPFDLKKNQLIAEYVPNPHAGRAEHAIYIECGSSHQLHLPDKSIHFVITDPPFFDNVHYSELADFFFAWQRLYPHGFVKGGLSTRSCFEVQDTDPNQFSTKLEHVFSECYRVLHDDGLLIFTYHHSRAEGWNALYSSIINAGFVIIQAHPVRSELAVALPKAQAKAPIQLDVILVCRKQCEAEQATQNLKTALALSRDLAIEKASRLIKIAQIRCVVPFVSCADQTSHSAL